MIGSGEITDSEEEPCEYYDEIDQKQVDDFVRKEKI